MEPSNPGETPAPPAEPAAPAAPPADPNGQPPAQPEAPGTEPDKNPAMVPSDRLREETEKRRKAEEEAQTLRDELAAAQTPPPADEPEIEEDTEKLLDAYAKKRGLVSQEELAAERDKIRVQQDIHDLTANPPVSGIPYDNKAVMDYAKANNLPITSKNALIAAYRSANWDRIMEVERQKAIEGYRTAGASGAELPGSSGAIAPTEPELTAKTPRERTKERIRNTRQKLNI